MAGWTRPLSKRFWEKVDLFHGITDEDCWEWNASRFQDEYGLFYFAKKRPVLAHRMAWKIVKGEIPNGLCVLHHCDNPPCVNPSHLWLGTRAENNADKEKKGRSKYVVSLGEKHGRSKLKDFQILEIRKLSSEGMTQTKIASLFGTDPSNVSYIVNRKNWTHIEERKTF